MVSLRDMPSSRTRRAHRIWAAADGGSHRGDGARRGHERLDDRSLSPGATRLDPVSCFRRAWWMLFRDLPCSPDGRSRRHGDFAIALIPRSGLVPARWSTTC